MLETYDVSRVTGGTKLTYDDFKKLVRDKTTTYAEIIEEILLVSDVYFKAEKENVITFTHARTAITDYATQVASTYYHKKGKSYVYLIAAYVVLYIFEKEKEKNDVLHRV